MKSATVLEHLIIRLERASSLDGVADAVATPLRKLLARGPVEDLLSGTPLGHPAHPMLVAVPIGAWTSASVLDVLGGDPVTTRRLIALGSIAALPAAASGASDWLSTSQAERRVGLAHAVANAGALCLQLGSWRVRRNPRGAAGAVLSASALALTSIAGWLGGHLAYAQGVGVDTTAFTALPRDWADLCGVDEIGAAPSRHDVDGVPLVAFRHGEDIVVLADRCTHRGGPLHEGVLDDGCLTCPWHDSAFDASGNVVSGPATRPQPALQVRTREGRVQVRRDEERSLRLNPVR